MADNKVIWLIALLFGNTTLTIYKNDARLGQRWCFAFSRALLCGF